MPTGRRPRPTALKALEGNPGHRPLPKNEPQPLPITPECPDWLGEEARRMWAKLVPELERLQLVTIVDGEALAGACQSWGVYVECERLMTTEGRTYEYTNKSGATNILPRPEVNMANQALSQFRAFISEFGLTPASRVRLAPPGEKKTGYASRRKLTGVS